ncbi:DUF6364 family protein [uncultured Mucilaginibacter sp.]|uniref:DUF6364 family protein n=1 Tax=uncultured Mucilaginibacter sp. TaxID=797541 RepID=UPI00263181B7|nr:DUF6364 family protein [uncultured Mucilaginibacter sp.]
MNTKLTLTIEKEVIDKAKKYAKNREQSLSDLIESYLKAITVENDPAAIEITPIVKSLKGSFTAPEDFDYKKELSKRLSEKYL